MNDAHLIIADSIARQGWTVSHDLFSDTLTQELREEVLQQHDSGRLRPAHIGSGQAQTLRGDIRGDSILWIDPLQPTAAQAEYLAVIDRLRLTLNRELFIGLIDFEAQYAVYEPGTHYDRHVDRFRDSDARMISVVLYLNEHWREEDGGALRLTLDDGDVDIFPGLGTAVVFRSDTIPHEVRLTHRDRYSLTGWYRRRSFTDIYP
jgi:SM-20-related protein